ncbi:MAG: nicotinamide-nucleotide adenylyltransferase [Methanomassiliicoccales archaeon]|nr:MAG: nicotinamide-nucleotide adenylyltransferase [Methanomassiliicoccales archaeon]
MLMRALFLGRFQPFHCGHLRVVKEIAKKTEYLVIAMGSAQYSHSKENPFTSGERYTMISRTLNAEGIKNYHIVTLEDIHRYAVWVAHVVSHTPKFDVVYAHNPLSIRLFKEGGFEVVELELYKPELYSGTEIRRRMLAKEDWKNLVPKDVAEVIIEINGLSRLKELASKGMIPDE